jgi:uncharacterized repeat protein (TIGR03803 family)
LIFQTGKPKKICDTMHLTAVLQPIGLEPTVGTFMRAILCFCVALLAWGPAGAAPEFTILQALTSVTGGSPENPPILGADGNLYGAGYTGASGYGTIYTIHTEGTGFAVLYALSGGVTGAGPFGQLVQAPNGLLYGTTLGGGQSGQGEVFSYDISTGSFAVVHAFDYADGSTPYGGLAVDAQGNLYGATSAGGANGQGTVFSIAAGSGAFTLLASLSAATGGAPFSPLALGADGLLYGTATAGGTHGKGTIFRLATTGGTLSDVHDFAGSDGANPFSGLTLGRKGVLYGTTDDGGAGYGVVFSFQPKSQKLTVLHSFALAEGADPQGKVALDGAGNLLGTTFYGGQDNSGTIWRYDPKKQDFAVLVTLSIASGGVTNAGLTYAGAKSFFGGVLVYGNSLTQAGALFHLTE